MGDLFKGMLKDSESLFLDEMALDTEYMPKMIKYREAQQKYIADCIKPLFQKRNGKNLLIAGSPGIGKTVAVRHVLEELEQETDEIVTLYVNCWKKETPYKIALDLCDQVDFKFVHNRDTSELFKEIARILNKRSAVIVLDEADKLADDSVFYSLMEDIYRKTIIMITNEEDFIARLDQRIRSRLMPDLLEFKPYSYSETKGILQQRVEYAFVPGVVDAGVLEAVAETTHKAQDVRVGLHLLKDAGSCAEAKSSRKVLAEHLKPALEKLKDFQIKSLSDLDNDANLVLEIIKANAGKSTLGIFKLYKAKGGVSSYSTFQRRIKTLEKGKYVRLKSLNTGQPGRSTSIEYGFKKLDEF